MPTRTSGRKAAIALLVALFSSPFACSADKQPDKGGLMLIVDEEPSLGIDRIVIDIASNDVPVRTSDLRLPQDTTLPTSLGIASNDRPGTNVTIAVSAFRGDAAIDRRDLLVKNVPVDHVSQVNVMFSARCTAKVVKEGAFARSLCAAGTTCDPATSACVTSEVDGAKLPVYDPSVDPTKDATAPGDDAQTTVDAAPDAPSGLVTCTNPLEKRCDNKCVSVLDPNYGCGAPTCGNCDIDGSTVWGCTSGTCSLVACQAGYKQCNGKCVAVDDPVYGCGATTCDSTSCPAVAAGNTRICANGVCVAGACGAGTKKCGGSFCVPTIRQYGCESQTCNECAAKESCQGTPKTCGCTPDNVTPCKDLACGPTVNNCGQTIECPSTCAPGVACGGNTCGCVPNAVDVTCAGKECGTVVDNCGVKVQCPNTCIPGIEMCGSVTPNQCDAPPSCVGGGAGKTDCRGESCCTSTLLPGGSFLRKNDNALRATISPVRLDKYKVTVGRFRAFVTAWANGWRPQPGDGKHVHLNGGQGLVVTPSSGSTPAVYEPGWNVGYAGNMQTTQAQWDGVLAGSTYSTWTVTAGANETRPIANLQWWEAWAFCIWDGGFLPSFAETNFAHAGGDEQRMYPWGAAAPAPEYADYCATSLADGGAPPPCLTTPLPVGSRSLGDGRWGHADLVGGNRSWVLDADVAPASCDDCTSTGLVTQRFLLTGAGSTSTEGSLRTSFDDRDYPSNRVQTAGGDPNSHGVRCARVP